MHTPSFLQTIFGKAIVHASQVWEQLCSPLVGHEILWNGLHKNDFSLSVILADKYSRKYFQH